MAQQTIEQFGATVKAKHPEYQDLPDSVVGQKVLAKYPQYQDMVTQPPGFTKRLGEATGFPTSRKELEAMQPSLAEKIGGPAVTAGRAAVNYGKNLYSEGKIAANAQDDSYAPERRFLLRGVLGPFGGTGLANTEQDARAGNLRGVGGDVLGTLINAFLLRKGTAPAAETSANKLAFAAGKDTAAPIRSTLPNLREAAAGGPKPKTLDAFQSVVDSASRNITKEAGNALGPIANTQIFPTAISQKLQALITPNMFLTADGLNDIARIRGAATEFQRPWTLGELDAERMKINKRLNPFYNKDIEGQYASLGNRNVAIDKAISDTIRDVVYLRMDLAAGKPQGYFRTLKQKQGDLLNLQSSLSSETERLKDVTARAQGGPRISRENLGVHVGSSGTPHGFLRGIADIIKKPNPLGVANKRVAQGFSRGNPAARTITQTLPFRQTLFPPEPQQ